MGGDGHFEQGLDSLQQRQGSWEINQGLLLWAMHGPSWGSQVQARGAQHVHSRGPGGCEWGLRFLPPILPLLPLTGHHFRSFASLLDPP